MGTLEGSLTGMPKVQALCNRRVRCRSRQQSTKRRKQRALPCAAVAHNEPALLQHLPPPGETEPCTRHWRQGKGECAEQPAFPLKHPAEAALKQHLPLSLTSPLGESGACSDSGGKIPAPICHRFPGTVLLHSHLAQLVGSEAPWQRVLSLALLIARVIWV